eukprot:7884806-Karenia_brevis.AAC.1
MHLVWKNYPPKGAAGRKVYPPTGAACAYQNHFPIGMVGPDSKDDSLPTYIRTFTHPFGRLAERCTSYGMVF